jgi:phosphopantothenoylcysteine decarboxylase/phosphopantothenate--cysteine ligase
MPTVLHGKSILLGVTGSIAAYKAADLASKLVQYGALVDVVLTPEACRFVTPLTFQALTHRPVSADLFDPQAEIAMDHVALGRRADLVVVCPATAHTIARLSLGLADDALTTAALSATAPLVVAPAMDLHMFAHPTVREHLARLTERGAWILGPAEGRLASGLVGRGRMLEVPDVIGHLRWILGRTNGDLRGKAIVVTAGGTEEPLDPVRVLTNRSSGKMGFAVAEAARDRGARTILITAPTALAEPAGVDVVHVRTALEMSDAVATACRGADVLVMAAAVSDYRPAVAAPQKIKKQASRFSLELAPNPDILAEMTGVRIKVGFAAETEDVLANARKKLAAKSLDLLLANDVSAADSGFGADDNRVIMLDREGTAVELPLLPKYEVAQRLLDRIALMLAG